MRKHNCKAQDPQVARAQEVRQEQAEVHRTDVARRSNKPANVSYGDKGPYTLCAAGDVAYMGTWPCTLRACNVCVC